jgi:type III protein arginine methyltransferase
VTPASDDKESRMLEALISQASNHPRALVMLANHLMANGEGDRAVSLALQARTLAAGDPEIHLLASEVLNLNVAPWHFSIVHDEVRNAAFDGALRRIVRPGIRVLDIGSGTGLLAMMAARAGAGEVMSCEVIPSVAQAAHKIVSANGYADRICIIAKHSDALDLERDIGGPVDVVVSEVISSDLIGEQVLQTMEGAQRFLKAGGSVIPARGSVRVALANYSGIQRMRLGTVQGFDLSPFNELAPTFLSIKRPDRDITLLSDSADLFAFDFASGGPFPEVRSSVSLDAQGDGANGVAQWICLTTDATGEYENHPATHAVTSNWAVLFYPFIEGLQCQAGETIRVCGWHNRDRLRIWAERVDH